MPRSQLTILAAGAVFCIVFGFAASAFLSNARISKLESEVASEKDRADILANTANENEATAREYKAKAEYLERSLGEIRLIAQKQDEELKQIQTNTNARRDDVSRTRRVRTIDTTAAELCAKLAELGHPCGE